MLDLPGLPEAQKRQCLGVFVLLTVGLWPKEAIFVMSIGFHVSRVTLRQSIFGRDLGTTLLSQSQNRTDVGTVRV